jgi:hypothetical protein
MAPSGLASEALVDLIANLIDCLVHKRDIMLSSPRTTEPDGTVVIRVSPENWESLRSWQPSDFLDHCEEPHEVYDPTQDPALTGAKTPSIPCNS